MQESDALPQSVELHSADLELPLEVRAPAAFERPLSVTPRQARLLTDLPWVRSLGKLGMEVRTEGWKFPAPPVEDTGPSEVVPHQARQPLPPGLEPPTPEERAATRLQAPADAVLFKDRLLYLLQPPLENLFSGKQISVPFKPFPYQMEGLAFLMPRRAALLADEMGLGKAQPLDAKVLTPTGWKRMGDVQIGDAVVNSQGGTSRVIGVYPQGEKEIFRVEFSDGSATECCDDHLWEVTSLGGMERASRVLSLREIRSHLARGPRAARLRIPLTRPIEFSASGLTVDPYAEGRRLATGAADTIPSPYLLAHLNDRRALLQGLLDGVGQVEDGCIVFPTLSARQMDDVRFLVQTLGGTARPVSTSRHPFCLVISLPPEIEPFRTADMTAPPRHSPPARAIVAVTPVGRKPAQCIAVDAPDHLYVTDDCILTHNTMQTILSLRLLFHTGVIRRALLVCPKPLVNNWSRELRLWAEDLPFEIVGGNTEARRASWLVSNCPLKIVNYELLTRDSDFVADDNVHFDVVVLDEAQRIKNRDSRTAQVVCGLKRQRSWALTGTPIENRPEDLVNIFNFVDPKRIPPETPTKQLAELTSDCILRRVKEDVMKDMPPKIIRDAHVELTPAQRDAYEMAEREGVIRLNSLGDTITVQHVFELVMRLKQICNFDPLTGASAKLEQLVADLTEVAESGRKAIVFSQWVEPLEIIARAVSHLGPLQFHGKIPTRDRYAILDQFKADPDKHVILMSYATGSVGLNLQFTNYVFLFDRWWNPAIEDQAINRAHRLGQKDTVIVTRFIAQGTIEGRIADVLEQKRQLFNELIAQNGPPPAMGLSQDEIFGLFNLNKPRRRAA